MGLDRLVEAGFFDENFTYVDQPQELIDPQMQGVLASVINECALSGLTP